MEALSDMAHPLNVVTQESTRSGSFTISWVIESDGLAIGVDQFDRRWEAFWTGDTVIEARRM